MDDGKNLQLTPDSGQGAPAPDSYAPAITAEAVESRRAELALEPHRLAWKRIQRAIASTDGSPADRAAAVADVRAALRMLPDLDVRAALAREAEKIAQEAGVELRAAEVLRVLAAEDKPENGRKAKDMQGRAVIFTNPDPWPEPVDGAALLDEICAFIVRFLVVPTGAAVFMAAWALASYAVEAFEFAAYLIVRSPVARCGKSRVFEVLETLVRRPKQMVNASGPSLYRTLEKWHPTALIDEAEELNNRRSERAADLLAILNAGYRRGLTVPRCDGERNEVRDFDVFGFKAVAVIGRLPDTIEDRSVLIEMRRKSRSERVERFRIRRARAEALELRRKCARWAADHLDELRDLEPPLPDLLDDRAQDIWEPLLAVALLAGGASYDRLVAAAATLTGTRVEDTAKAQLLADLRGLFDGRGDRLASETIVKALGEMEDRPWPEWRNGKPITTRQLAELLRDFGVRPTNIRVGNAVVKGYKVEDFEDTWGRYLPPTPASDPLQGNNLGATTVSGRFGAATRERGVAEENCGKPAPRNDCSGVADPGQGGGGGDAGPGLDPDVPLPGEPPSVEDVAETWDLEGRT